MFNLSLVPNILENPGGGVLQNVYTLLRLSSNSQRIIDLSKQYRILNKNKTSPHIKCLYTNATLLNNKIHELTIDFIQNEVSIVFISETW